LTVSKAYEVWVFKNTCQPDLSTNLKKADVSAVSKREIFYIDRLEKKY
jgi:hypothetical protein